ncbi:MAG: protein GlxC, partial [Mesorhizobium sp.]
MPATTISKAQREQGHARIFDLGQQPLRELNQALHQLTPGSNETAWEVLNPKGSHSVAVGVDQPVAVDVRGSVGYYCGGMNAGGAITVHGSAGPGVGENMMSGSIVVKGDASQYAGATGRGGLLVIEG